MNKLTTVGAGLAPVFTRRARAAAFRVTYPDVRVTHVARRGLHCGWTKDANGNLTCNWSETGETRATDAPVDAPSNVVPCKRRRGFGHAGLRSAAPYRLCA